LNNSEEELRYRHSSDDQTDWEGPKPSDVYSTLAISIVFLGGCLFAVFFFKVRPLLPLAIALLILALFFIGSWHFAQRKKSNKPSPRNSWLIWYTNFGIRLWHFPGLWYIVFLVGIYLAAISALSQFDQNVVPGASVNTTDIWLSLIKNIIIAAFLAVLTSVLAHTFTSIGKLTKNLESVTSDSKESAKKVKGILDEVENMSDEVKNMSKDLYRLNKILQIGVSARRTTERIYVITSSSRDLEIENEDMKPMTRSLLDMCDDVERYHDVALHPLLAPGITPAKGDNETDPVIQIASRLSDPNESPHYAYMSAAIGRYFNSEVTERQFPGILLQVTSFAYYIRTIDRIVQALEPWYDRFEFYTFMPKCPIELFRFSNSQDINEWLEFLLSYCDFQTKNKGMWKRYFAYDDDGQHNGFIPISEIGERVRQGFVVTEENSWLPKIIQNSEVNKYFKSDDKNFTTVDKNEIKRIIEENEFYGKIGTLATKPHASLPKEYWRKIHEVLLEYHGLVKDESDEDKISKKFIYRSVNDCDLLNSLIQISSRKGETNISTRSFNIPVDFFAIRDRQLGIESSSWVFFIGLDSGLQKKSTDIQLAFAPVLDLVTMAHDKSGNTNNTAAKRVREMLQKVFVKIDETNTKTHSELIKSGNRNA